MSTVDRNLPAAPLRAWLTLDRAGDTVTVTREGGTVAQARVDYRRHAVNAWDSALVQLGYQRVSSWWLDDTGFHCDVLAFMEP